MTIRFQSGAVPRAIFKDSSCCCLLLVGARLYLKLAYYPDTAADRRWSEGRRWSEVRQIIQRSIKEEAPGFSQMLAQGLLGDP